MSGQDQAVNGAINNKMRTKHFIRAILFLFGDTIQKGVGVRIGHHLYCSRLIPLEQESLSINHYWKLQG